MTLATEDRHITICRDCKCEVETHAQVSYCPECETLDPQTDDINAYDYERYH